MTRERDKRVASFGEEIARALSESRWWEGRLPADLVRFQLFTAELCLPFGLFHEALADVLGRGVSRRELTVAGATRLRTEFLRGQEAPTRAELLALVLAQQ